jgi:hypothetical protein
MRHPLIALFVVFTTAGALYAQLADPLPARVEKRGLMVEVRDVVRLPDTRGLRPADQDVNPQGWARINYVRELADGRRFANDLRGVLYRIDGGQPVEYANLGAAFPLTVYNRLEAGFIGLAFHPDFAQNGLFYTSHSETAMGNPATPNFIPPGFTQADVNIHLVWTEWRATNPAAATFQGTRREIFRVGSVVGGVTHPMAHLHFNPTARSGSPDYGLLYIGGTDMGFSNGQGPNARNPEQTQRLDSIVGAILRIDPRSPSVSGGMKGLGDYTIPAVNKFAADGDPKTLGEIFAYGFRNAHKLSWDANDGTMFAVDIGMNHIEEVNIVREGENYGWMKREGFFLNEVTRGGPLNQLFPMPADALEGRTRDGFTYPVAVYDHNDGQAVTGGFAYYGAIPALRGKFLFGDIARGRLFAADVAAMKKADDGVPQTVAPIEEIQLYIRNQDGARTYVTFRELTERTMGATLTRADLHLHRGRDGEIFITSRQDGTIRLFVPDSGGAATASVR